MRVAGFNDSEASAISNAAYEYKRQIDPLDTEVDNIKNANWPNPTEQVKVQLTQLQQQKEAIIASLVGTLHTQLNSYSDNAKLSKHITEVVKKKTKGFAVGLPIKKTSSIRNYISNLFSVSAQAFGCDTYVYIYCNTVVDYSIPAVYADSSWSGTP